MRNLAKSLHTITALVNVAKHLDVQQAAGVSAFKYASVKDLVDHASIVLGLSGMPDVYGLKAKAAAQLDAAQGRAIRDAVVADALSIIREAA